MPASLAFMASVSSRPLASVLPISAPSSDTVTPAGVTAVLFIDRDHAGHADRLRAGLDAVVCRQRQTHRRLGRRIGLAVRRGERDVGHRVRELVDRRVQTGVNLEGQCGQLALDRGRRLKVQRQHGLLKAGLGVRQFSGHAVGIGHRPAGRCHR